MESSRTAEHALVVLTSPEHREKLTRTVTTLAAAGGGKTVATELLTSYNRDKVDEYGTSLNEQWDVEYVT